MITCVHYHWLMGTWTAREETKRKAYTCSLSSKRYKIRAMFFIWRKSQSLDMWSSAILSYLCNRVMQIKAVLVHLFILHRGHHCQPTRCSLSYMMMTGGAQRQVKVILVGIGCVRNFWARSAHDCSGALLVRERRHSLNISSASFPTVRLYIRM